MSLTEAYLRFREEGGLVDLTGRAIYHVTGTDRVRFLNGQVSNDMRNIPPGRAKAACVTTAKGKMNGLIFVSDCGNYLRFDTDGELRESMAARMERYIISDDVVIEDVSDHFGFIHLFPLDRLGAEESETVRIARRFGVDGFDLLVPRVELEASKEQLLAGGGFQEVGPELAEVLRIEAGAPKWGAELSDDTIPVEAGLEEQTIDYAKGCYIGQEVISRIKSIGQVARKLFGLVSLDGKPLVAGAPLRAAAEPDGREAGRITSAAYSLGLERHAGLGYIKRAFAEPGGRVWLECDGAFREVEIRALPLY